MSAPVKLPVDRSRESLGSLSEGWTSVSKQLLCLQTVMTSDTHTDLSAAQGQPVHSHRTSVRQS